MPQLRSGKFNVLLTTYEYIIKDKHILAKVCRQPPLIAISLTAPPHLALRSPQGSPGPTRDAGGLWGPCHPVVL